MARVRAIAAEAGALDPGPVNLRPGSLIKKRVSNIVSGHRESRSRHRKRFGVVEPESARRAAFEGPGSGIGWRRSVAFRRQRAWEDVRPRRIVKKGLPLPGSRVFDKIAGR